MIPREREWQTRRKVRNKNIETCRYTEKGLITHQ